MNKQANPSHFNDPNAPKVLSPGVTFFADDQKSTMHILPKIYEGSGSNPIPDGRLDTNISTSKRRPTVNDRISFHMASNRSLMPPQYSKPTVNVIGTPATMADKSHAQSSGRLLAVPGKLRASPKQGSPKFGASNRYLGKSERYTALDHSEPVNMVACNASCTYFVTKKGVFSIGNKDTGLLGFENTAYLLNQPVPIDLSFSIQVEGIHAGRKHVVIWDNHGIGYAWGSNKYGQLGVENNEMHTSKFFKKPEKIHLCSKKKLIGAVAGCDSTTVITNKGKIFYWGMPVKKMGASGKLFDRITQLKTPDHMNKVSFIKVVHFDYEYAAMDTLGRLFTWGLNFHEHLGFKDKYENWKTHEANYVIA